MIPEARLQALSEFLKTQRAKISPQMAGLPMGTRRRTPGLRREEVAQLAGVSTTWYTWLEQGRDIKVSAAVSDAVSDALQLNKDERNYLYALALDEGVKQTFSPEEETIISPALTKMVQELRYCPTIISDRRCHIVGWNQAAAHVFLDFEQIPPEKRNLIELLFSRKELRSLAVNWEHFVKGFIAIFRTYYGQYVADKWYSQFIEKMEHAYSEFHTLWNESEVSSAPEVLIEFRHAKAGKMVFNLTLLQVQGNSDLRCSVYTPAENTETESKLKRLIENK
ncbi:helix-turn-helix domain-containing protein [Bacillus sp. ISL-51]|uniref:helix-turn-helix transcriptional regulator n=1 Tax=Bacteria TaxID=2 RepID=UPI001BE5FEEC|nr:MULTISPECIES: helix-turn-helix transcriptional regulator [Bacteria]MBT2573096.1 helix-turn-helix domain-containing protein [Bacillus sp. ISL-51]MBT2634999.1 helix-turn-helix domain-containing protein [Bacillus sp. ISL-26]MBT2712085.1 helix-turn-helix domain-containing protein [Pseudomonas sp. ISL-88]